jgi:hypothetical protein
MMSQNLHFVSDHYSYWCVDDADQYGFWVNLIEQTLLQCKLSSLISSFTIILLYLFVYFLHLVFIFYLFIFHI